MATTRHAWIATVIAAAAVLAACKGEAPDAIAAVTGERITNADSEPQNWLSHGRTYSEQRYSPLEKINASNVSKLGLAWMHELATPRAAESTPIVVDGVMYVTGPWSIVYALDAKTGRQLWVHDPKVPREKGFQGCCDVVNRGVAVWQGLVFIATFDGRLQALDAHDGHVVWSQLTVDVNQPYTITGAPRVVKGKVLIGNGGGEYGVRGYVTAYDARTGAKAWRFYTVPGNPAGGPDGEASDEAMKIAAPTWTGEWWKYGGGGTVWDSMAYDPELGLLYIGVGNGSPWNQQVRSPGGGDNLFLSSIVALNADTGKYVWHYQTTPGDTWDYTAAQHIILADLTIDGKLRKVLMQAPKNGFFYVIDRVTGQLISAKNFVPINWATGVDMKTGRPIEVPEARYRNSPFLQMPAPFGAHNWQPMSYSPQTGLVYIPAQETVHIYGTDPAFQYRPGAWNTGTAMVLMSLPEDPKVLAGLKSSLKGRLLAWDPVTQREVWRSENAGPWNGGTLATAGGLVFEGSLDGHFSAFDARTGARLWQTDTWAATLSGPVTYAVDGEQYVAVLAGNGSTFMLAAGFTLPEGQSPVNGRVYVYKLGGSAKVAPPPYVRMPTPKPPEQTATAEVIARGNVQYMMNCGVCHGISVISGGVLPDLRRSGFIQNQVAFEQVVLKGTLRERGMVSFERWLTPADVEAIRAYIIKEAWPAYRAEQAAPAARAAAR